MKGRLYGIYKLKTKKSGKDRRLVLPAGLSWELVCLEIQIGSYIKYPH